MPSLRVEGLFEELNKKEVNYVVLRWFEKLPRIEEDEDIDLLICDEDLYKLQGLFLAKPEPGAIKCDIYSVTGVPGSDFEGLPYYEARLAKQILDNAIFFNQKYRVPDPLRHLLSLAYHVVFHKAEFSELPVCSDRKPLVRGVADHDYAEFLTMLANKVEVKLEPTLQGLFNFLSSYDWIPSIDLVRKLSHRRLWLRQLYPPADPEVFEQGELSVFIIREWAEANGWSKAIIKYLGSQGFDVKAVCRLNQIQKRNAASVLRGGNWNRGPWPVSGGKPEILVAAYDYCPIMATNEIKKKHPYLSNLKVIGLKTQIRTAINNKLASHKHTNPIYSTDDELEAWQYIKTIGGCNLVNQIKKSISNGYEGDRSVKYKIHKGRRADTYITYQTGEPAVLKIFHYTDEGRSSMQAEKIAMEVFQGREWAPKWIDSGDNWILQKYYPTPKRLDIKGIKLKDQEKKVIACKIILALEDIYNEGYAHRDVHCKNIFIVNGTPVLIDYETLCKQNNHKDFFSSYDITARGLESPYNTQSMCFNNNRISYSIRNVLGVSISEVKKIMKLSQ